MSDINVTWSEEDLQWVGTCDEYPSLSYLADTPKKAGAGILELVHTTRDNVAAGRSVESLENAHADRVWRDKWEHEWQWFNGKWHCRRGGRWTAVWAPSESLGPYTVAETASE